MMVSNPATAERSRIHRMDVFFSYHKFFFFFFKLPAQGEIVIEIRYSDANPCETEPFEGPIHKRTLGHMLG